MIIACATDDGINFVSSHFGDAKQYYIYKLKEDGYSFIDKINNITEKEKEEIHADPKKAKSIVNLLKNNNVQVGVAKVFGPNIKRVVKHFVPVIVSENTIKEGLETIVTNYHRINEIISNNSKDTYLNLKNNIEGKINVL